MQGLYYTGKKVILEGLSFSFVKKKSLIAFISKRVDKTVGPDEWYVYPLS